MLKSARFNKILMWMIASVVAISMVLMPASKVFADASIVSADHTLLAKSDVKSAAVVTLANRFSVSKEQLPDFLERWNAIGTYMKKQPGFVSAALQKDILNTREWVMSEQWKSLESYKKAVSTEQFQALIQDFPGTATWFAQDLFPTR
jgi:quinol monooxygenase YgiN